MFARPLLLSLALSTLSLPVAALELNFSSHNKQGSICQYQIDKNIKLSAAQVTLGGTQPIVLGNDGSLQIEGKPQTLGADDKAKLRDYAAALRQFVPEVHNIAIEGVSLGLEAMTLVQAGLSGKAPDPDRLAEQQALKNALFSARSKDTLNTDDFPFALDKHYEAELFGEFASATWDISAIALKESLLGMFNPARAEALEARTEAMEAKLDSYIESRAEALENRGDALCATVKRLDSLERELGLFDLFQFKADNGNDKIAQKADSI